MKEIRLGARLSAYSKVDALQFDVKEMTKCDVDRLFGEECNNTPCPDCSESPKNPNLVTRADIDALFR